VGVLLLLSLAVKLMLLPVYHGIAFEQHSRWLRLTYDKPAYEWYSRVDSDRDLAYPPVFAYFKMVLSHIAVILGVLSNQSLSAYFQRFTVILGDQVLLLGMLLFCSTWPSITTTDMAWSRNKVVVVVAMVLFDPGLVLVDHVYLNYTGLAAGLLVMSVSFLRRGDDTGDIISVCVFLTLVFFDQSFAFIAPLYIVYLFRHYCCQLSHISTRTGTYRRHSSVSSSDGFSEDRDEEEMDPYFERQMIKVTAARRQSRTENRSTTEGNHLSKTFRKILTRPRRISNLEIHITNRSICFKRCFALVSVVTLFATICFAPIVTWHPQGALVGLNEIANVMIPKATSVCRKYWAPNVWALYLGFDKLLVVTMAQFWGFELPEKGIFGEDSSDLNVLPGINWFTCMFFTLVAMAPALRIVWDNPHPPVFVPAFIYCMVCAFMLGFSVHERSVLYIVVPLALTSCDSTMDARLYILLSWIGHVSVLPLLNMPGLKALKPILLALHCFGSYIALDQYHIMARRARRIRPEPNGGGIALYNVDIVFFIGLAFIYVLGEVLNPSLPFLTRQFPGLEQLFNNHDSITSMSISIYCAFGMIHCWMLASQQLDRKVALIESYQWSPHSSSAEKFELDHDRHDTLTRFHLE